MANIKLTYSDPHMDIPNFSEGAIHFYENWNGVDPTLRLAIDINNQRRFLDASRYLAAFDDYGTTLSFKQDNRFQHSKLYSESCFGMVIGEDLRDTPSERQYIIG